MKMIKNIKKFFETEYWYRWRKIISYWFDKDDKKYKVSYYPKKASNIINSTWEGENDLLMIMLLKADHMFWNLKKYGMELNYYFYNSDIQKYGSTEDKIYILRKIINSLKNQRFFLFNGTVEDKALSESGLVHFYLSKNERYICIEADLDKKNPNEDGYRTLLTVKAGVYELYNDTPKEIEKLLNYLARDVREYVDIHNISVKVNLNDLKEIIIAAKSDEGFEIKELPYLSRELKNHAIGNFVKCKEILHLRHLIKNILNLDSMDYKDEQLYISNRKKAYSELATFMAEKGDRWWD